MTDYEKEEFWKGLGRLYEESVRQSQKLSEVGDKLNEVSEVVANLSEVVTGLSEVVTGLSNAVTGLSGSVTGLTGVVTDLSQVVNQLANVAQSHEKRLDRTEVTVEAILEDLRRNREGRGDPPGMPG